MSSQTGSTTWTPIGSSTESSTESKAQPSEQSGPATARRSTSSRPIPRTGKRPGKSAKWQKAMRWLHVYTSMIAFVVILFFGATGILLNHPSWLFGDDLVTTTNSGTLPTSVFNDEGDIEFLAVSEYVRTEYGVGGEVTNFDVINNEGSINYTGPAYGATVRFEVETLNYEVVVREEGFVNAMRDLHTGSDSGAVWSFVIDASAIFLVFVAVTGLGIQLFLRKRRRSALSLLGGGAAVTAILIWVAMV